MKKIARDFLQYLLLFGGMWIAGFVAEIRIDGWNTLVTTGRLRDYAFYAAMVLGACVAYVIIDLIRLWLSGPLKRWLRGDAG
jgi:hypothetical protein